jgi:hypothetical protein
MNKRQAVKYSLIYMLTILFGAFIAFKVWWTNGETKYLGVIAFFLVGFGSLFLSIAMTRIIIPTETDFSYSTLSDKKKYQILKDTIGSTKVKFINASYISLFLTIFAGTSYGLVTSLNKYEKEQLETFGRLQKVRISDIQYKGKGSPYAFFDFYLDGKKYTNELSPKNYSIGDSVRIIFSTNNTDIVKWADEDETIDQ